ncbi:MAG: ABC transporter permease [Peptostreptococcaceae bacterium]|nr:ABC transporter permease [Peptostreptococcaceae bacterium]
MYRKRIKGRRRTEEKSGKKAFFEKRILGKAAFGKECDRKTAVWAAACGLWMLVLLTIFFSTDLRGGELQYRFLPPSPAHPFGTDQHGRDLFVRTVHGFICGFFPACAVTGVSFIVGAFFGSIAGYYGGLLRDLLHYCVDLLLVIPTIILFLLLASMMGSSTPVLIGALTLTDSLYKARICSAEVLVMKHEDYILNLRISGASDLHIIFFHLFPGALRLMAPLLAMHLGHTLLSISGLSFLGFGMKPPRADIGALMKDALRFAGKAPHLLLCPGAFQLAVIFCFNKLSESMRKKSGPCEKKI